MNLYKTLENCDPKLKRRMVWCKKCGRSQKVYSVKCFQFGWPECCGETMTIDAPIKRRKVKGK